jgi:hypothetical protein
VTVWEKRGLVIEPPRARPWAASHAAVPTVDAGPDGVYVYFTTRDSDGRGHVARAEVDLEAGVVVRYDDEPVLSPGPLGRFDDSGVMSSCIVRRDGAVYLYYVGWLRGVTVPFYTYTGLAVSRDGGERFERVSPAPVVDRSRVDPYMAHSPCVLAEDGVWRMWYSSATEWRLEDGRPKHWYHVKYAESPDGLRWQRSGQVCIDFRDESEYAIARAWVLRDAGVYRMWFTHRGDAYRIGYAESVDGITWERSDEDAGIDVGASGWDSEMVAYACVFDHGGRRHMLYNGNGYGRTGIGHAVLTSG